MIDQVDMFGTTAPASNAERELRVELHKTRDELRKLQLVAPKSRSDGWTEVERLRRDNRVLQARIDALWARLPEAPVEGSAFIGTALEAQTLRAKVLVANKEITESRRRGVELWDVAKECVERLDAYIAQEDERAKASRALVEAAEALHQEGLAREEALRRRI